MSIAPLPTIVIDCKSDSQNQPLTVGLPFPRGALREPITIQLVDDCGIEQPIQTAVLARWPDGSVRWLLLDTRSGILSAGTHVWQLRPGDKRDSPSQSTLDVASEPDRFFISTGVATFQIQRSATQPILTAALGEQRSAELTLAWTDAAGRNARLHWSDSAVESAGPVRATICLRGEFAATQRCRVVARFCFFAGTGLIRCRVTVHNPRRARHRGNLWDLGDPGSILFRDLSLELKLSHPAQSRLRWSAEPGQPFRESQADEFEVYQDSSGGENWRSRNHVNRRGEVPLRFQGYRLRVGDNEIAGRRANPVVRLIGPDLSVAAALPEFWQQFPKAIDAGSGVLRIRLFPRQFGYVFERHVGEQKTHTFWLEVARPDVADDRLDWVHRPAIARAEPDGYATSGAFLDLLPCPTVSGDRFETYLQKVIEGPNSLFSKREVIDEYGWRNYGDVYADHENAYYPGQKPVISHYNNQFDSILGALIQFARTGDRRWRDLADPLARHVIDIDIYHTEADRAAYRGGLFWMTDHYLDAATSTHRTFSRANRKPGRSYGGGPGAEHNFTTGLLYYHYMTGDPLAREAVISLAEWVIRMDDGRLSRWRWLDDGPTGLASMTGNPDYHGPGRGAGLSINAVLDGWLLTGESRFIHFAEMLIRRCIHPRDNLEKRDLLNGEQRWSVTIFLTSIARYLRLKAEAGAIDRMYAYARESLLHYARWMADHDRPYLDQRDRLEFPTETWPAQDLRKANVLRLAAAHADEPLRSKLLCRGDELAERAWADLINFESRHAARPAAIVLTEGTRDQHFRANPPEAAPRPATVPDFGEPERFICQGSRIKALLRSPHKLLAALLRHRRESR